MIPEAGFSAEYRLLLWEPSLWIYCF